MISCKDVLSDEESDSHIESEVQKYVDSDRADSDIEIELYSQIHFAEDLNATVSTQSFRNNSSYIFDVSPVKNLDSLFFKSNTELPCDVKQGTSEIMKLNHFESSTPKISVKNNLIVGKKNVKTEVGNKAKLLKAKTGKVALKPSKSSEDSGCFESATCSDDRDGDDSDESVVILEPSDVITNAESKEVIFIDSSPASNDISLAASPKVSDSEGSSKFSLSATSSVANTSGNKVKLAKAKMKKVALKPSKSSKSVTYLDGSESDDSDESLVILDPPGDVITNVRSKDVVFSESSPASNDVSSDRSSASPELSDSDDSLRFSFGGSSSVANTSGELWRIDHEDRFAFIKKQKRYHEKRSLICNNCKKKGHLSKDCVEPRNTKCYICGRDHVWSMCHQRMCGRCLEYGHSTRKCRYKAYELSCDLCKMRGHGTQDCPDLWRRYHLTTCSDSIVKGSKEISQSIKKYCYNCGHEGHYGHECLRPRMSPDSFPTWPFIISYKDPFRQLLKKHYKKSSAGESSRHFDSHSRHKHKKHRSHTDDLRALMSGKHPSNSKKSRNKDKKLHDDKYSSLIRGNDFPRSSSIIVLDEEGPKNKKKRKRDIDKLYAFKRKKQKLNTTV